MVNRKCGVLLVVLVVLGASAFGLDFPLEDAGYLSAQDAEREIIGRWRLVAGYDTQRPEFSRLVPPTETPWLEFRQDKRGTDATGPVQEAEFTWEISERDSELWISMHFPDFGMEDMHKLLFSTGRMILIWPDIERSGDTPVINAIVHERQ